MTVSVDEFKQGMRHLGGAVTIVTTRRGEVVAGLTATAVTSLSASPPRLLACINRAGMTYETLSGGRTLCVNVLGCDHQALAERFAGLDGTPETERFTTVDWYALATGAPALTGALVSFDCRVESVLDVGSHGIVIGNIVHVSAPDPKQDPLCYKGGLWQTLTPLVAPVGDD